jgi:hypothetical protein
MERFNLKKLNKVERKEHFVLRFQIELQLWDSWRLRRILIVLGKRLEGI